MGVIRKLRTRWIDRRDGLATDQIMAERITPDPTAELLKLDATTGSFVAQHRALNRLLGPKGKSSTEWRGD